ncbi:hypothetical protein [Pararhodobacter sp. CCB-MM2]|uniref:hypothetical protein n=1 Tax=Pararhodobacter sp. CCB-MM2 TaxID=1786003 RepID=UPI00082A851D|nr:hypothetical protein [Pararhodobacter sp. CCB-MM2]MCA2012806.1 hypothetical protein [Cereibacter sphaeroides]
MPRLWILALLMIALGLLPVLGVVLSSGIAEVAGCALNEGGVQPCVILGLDWGPVLAFLFVGGWFFFLTAPVALGGMLLGIGLALAALIRRSRD